MSDKQLNPVWVKAMELIKTLTGDVDTSKGTLQEQCNEMDNMPHSTPIGEGADIEAPAYDAKDVAYEDENGLGANNVQDAIDKMVGTYSNPNLLDNPWFTVNQRGLTEASSSVYTADRWIQIRGTIKCNDDKSITLTKGSDNTKNSYLSQRFEKNSLNYLLGKIVTLSFMDGNNKIYSFTTVLSNTAILLKEVGDYQLTFDLKTVSAYELVYIGLKANSTLQAMTIKAVKLELGSVSTLALDTAPNYQQELAKCQRYFQRLYKGVENTPVGSAFVRNATTLVQILHLPVAMAKQPTITVSGDVKALGSKDITNLTPIIDGSIGSSNEKDKTIIRLNYTITGGTVGQSFLLATGPNGFTLELSADL